MLILSTLPAERAASNDWNTVLSVEEESAVEDELSSPSFACQRGMLIKVWNVAHGATDFYLYGDHGVMNIGPNSTFMKATFKSLSDCSLRTAYFHHTYFDVIQNFSPYCHRNALILTAVCFGELVLKSYSSPHGNIALEEAKAFVETGEISERLNQVFATSSELLEQHAARIRMRQSDVDLHEAITHLLKNPVKSMRHLHQIVFDPSKLLKIFREQVSFVNLAYGIIKHHEF